MLKSKKLNKIKGSYNEAVAFNYIKKNLKYKILATNYKNKIGEIDIIALDKTTIVFIEVKSRETTSFGLPREAVDQNKQHKLKLVATLFLKENNLYEECKVRFDICEIIDKEINYLINAF